MKVLIAIDSMKGSLSSLEANQVVSEVFKERGHQVIEIAIADGGEGTVEAVIENNSGKIIPTSVHSLGGQKITAEFGWFEKEKMAVIETAAASGIQFLDGTLTTHPKNTSSYGTGELILAAIDKGAQKIIIGLGGTGTVDGGIGLLSALGVEFYNKAEEILPVSGGILDQITRISTKNLSNKVKEIEFLIASDVDSQLTGTSGAVQMFGKQKGIKEEEVIAYDRAMKKYQETVIGKAKSQAGDGAAGGIGFALRTFLNGKMYSGIHLISQLSHLEEQIKTVDLVITGEGKMDNQSLHGKVPVGIGRMAKKYQVPVVAFVGSFLGDDSLFEKEGISVIVPIIDKITSLEEAMENAKQNLQRTSKRSLKLLELIEKK